MITKQDKAEIKKIVLEALRELVKETEYLHTPEDPEGRYYCSKSNCEGVRFSDDLQRPDGTFEIG